MLNINKFLTTKQIFVLKMSLERAYQDVRHCMTMYDSYGPKGDLLWLISGPRNQFYVQLIFFNN